MNFKKSLAKISALLLLALVMPMASVFAQTFAQPQSAPPNGNVPAPINVGGTAQTRTGDLTLENMLTVLGNLIVNTNGIIKSTLKVGGSVMSSGYTLDVTNDNPNGVTLKTVLGALLTQVIRVQSLAHVGGDQPVCATAAGDLVLCGNPPVTPIVITLTANPTSVASGSTSSITWSATGATSCNPLQGYGFTVANGATSGTDTTGALTNSTQNTFIISCTNGTITETKAVTVAINSTGPLDAAFSVALQATTPGQIYAPVSSVVLGDDYVIRYTTQGVRNTSPQCTAATYGPVGSTTPAWTGNKTGETSLTPSTSVSAWISPTIPGTYTHTITCWEPNGTSLSDTISVVVTSAPVIGIAAPTLSLTTSNTSVAVGQNYTLEWETANIRSTAPKCVATTSPVSGTNWSGNKGANSTDNDVPPLSAVITATAPGTYVHTLTCYGENGSVPQSVSDSVTVTVTANAPTINLVASASTIALGQTANLTWTGTNLTSCTASANPAFNTWSGNKPTSSTTPVTVVPTVVGTKVFTLTCLGQNGSTVTDTASINVVATSNPTIALYYNNAGVQGDDVYISSYSTNFTLGFSATNISRCELTDTTGNPQSGWDSSGWLTPQNGTTTMSQANTNFTLPNGMQSVTYTITCEKLINGQVTGTATNWVTVNYAQPVTTTLFYKGPGSSTFTQLQNTNNVATISSPTAQFYIGFAQSNATTCQRTATPAVAGWPTAWSPSNIANNPSPTNPITLGGNSSVTFTYQCKNGLNVVSTKSLTVNFVQPITITNVTAGSIGSAAATITATINGATTSYLQMATTSNGVISATHQPVTLSGTSFTKQVQPLVYNTTYYYRVCAAAATGSAVCSTPISQFTTTNPVPTFASTAASAITQNSATISSVITPNGTAITSRTVQYCANGTAGCSSTNVPPAAPSVPLITSSGTSSGNLSSLSTATTYNYKVCVNYDHGSGTPTLTACDTIKSFTTVLPAPTITEPNITITPGGPFIYQYTNVSGTCVDGATVTITRDQPTIQPYPTRSETCVGGLYETSSPIPATGIQSTHRVSVTQTLNGITSAAVTKQYPVCNSFCVQLDTISQSSVNAEFEGHAWFVPATNCPNPEMKVVTTSPTQQSASTTMITPTVSYYLLNLTGLQSNASYYYSLYKTCTAGSNYSLVKNGSFHTNATTITQSATQNTYTTVQGNPGNQVTKYHKDITASATVNLAGATYYSSSFDYKPSGATSWTNVPTSLSGGTTINYTLNLMRTSTAYGQYQYRFCVNVYGGQGQVCAPWTTI